MRFALAPLLFAAIFTSALAQDSKSSEDLQYVPATRQILKDYRLLATLAVDDEVILTPISVPADPSCMKTCVSNASALVRMSVRGSDGRKISLAETYDVEVSFLIKGYSGGIPIWEIPGATQTLRLLRTVSVEQSDASYIASLNAVLSQRCGISSSNVDDEIGLVVTAITWNSTPQSIKDSVRLEFEIKLETSVHPYTNFTTFNFSSPPNGPAPNPSTVTTTSNRTSFAWTYPNCGDIIPAHQVEILRLYNTFEGYRTDPEKCIAIVDWNKAQRVYVYGKGTENLLSTALTIAEGSGWYTWRVRPIGNKFPGGMANDSNFGKWSSAPVNGNTIDLAATVKKVNGSASTLDPDAFFLYTQFDANKNWKFERVFAEDRNGGNGSAESMTYATSTLQPIQTQKPIPSTGDVLVQQTVLDYQGRPLLQTLPAPKDLTLGGDNLGFMDDVAEESSGVTPYRAEHFDASDNWHNPGTMVGLAATYYGSTNDGYHLPEAGGYPFVRSLLTPDPLARASEQSAAGSVLRLQTSDSKTTQTLYATATERELVSVFGCEAPSPTAVTKVITRDPNGVVSYTYQRQDGKVLATCLSTATSALSMLDLPLGSEQTILITDSLQGGLRVTDDSIYQSMTLVVPEEATYTFRYGITKGDYSVLCPELACRTCDYEVRARVKKLGESTYTMDKTYQYKSGTCTTPANQDTTENAYTLSAGTYIMERTLHPLRPPIGQIPAVDTVINARRLSHAALVQERLEHYLVGTGVTAANLASFRDGSLPATPQHVANRELWAKSMLARYKTALGVTNALYSDVTHGCCTIRLPVANCITGCETQRPNYEAMLKAAAASQPDILTKLGTTTPSTARLFWNYGGDSLLKAEGDYPDGNDMINQLMANMEAAGYDCEKIYECWYAAVQSYTLVAWNEVTPDVYEKNLAFNLLDYFLECVGTKYCTSTPITDRYTNLAWVLNAWKVLPSPVVAYTPTTPDLDSTLCKADLGWTTPPMCNNDPEDDAATNEQYRALRGCYMRIYDATDAAGNKARDYAAQKGLPLGSTCTTRVCIKETLEAWESKCLSQCESWREAFTDSIIRMHLKAGRSIIGKPELVPAPVSQPDSVHMLAVLCTVSAMIESCREECSLHPITWDDLDADADGNLNELLSPTAAMMASWNKVMYSGSFRVTEPNTENVCPSELWTHIEHTTKIAEIIVPFLNEQLRIYADTVQQELSRWNVRYLLNEIGSMFPGALACMSQWDSNLNGWWNTYPPNQINPRDPFTLLVKKGDTEQGFYFEQIGEECLVKYRAPDMPEPQMYSAENPHPLVRLLNDYIDNAWAVEVHEDVLNAPRETVVTKTYTVGATTYTLYEVKIEPTPPSTVHISATDPLKPRFSNQTTDITTAVPWSLADDTIGCVNGDLTSLQDLSTLIDIRSETKYLLRKNESESLWVIGSIRISPCDVLELNIGPRLEDFAEHFEEDGSLSIRIGMGNIYEYVTLNANDEDFETAFENGFLKDKVRFVHGPVWLNDPDKDFLDISLIGGTWWRALCLKLDNCSTTTSDTSCNVVKLCNMCATVQCANVCFRWVATDTIQPASYVKPSTCAVEEVKRVIEAIEGQLNGPCLDTMLSNIEISYHKSCFSPDSVKDAFTAYRTEQLQHYTLYYYDRAGNLVKTVPPKGVDFLANTDGRDDCPSHTFVTRYAYNSMGQLVSTNTPDGGLTEFWYNDVGMLRVSRNAKQNAASPKRYSYTNYDELGRIVESGERSISGDAPQTNISAEPMAFSSAGAAYITATTYTTVPTAIPQPWNGVRVPQNLLNRISQTLTDEDANLSTVDDQVLTFYSYDPHGNVEWLIQDLPGLNGGSGRKGILIEYEYDLISGRVMAVQQQRGRFDQVMRKYDYDHDGRVVSSSSSLDGWMWDRDAAYEYERHGPMRRIEYGLDSVQGADYVYTLNGWLKGINIPTLNHDLDPGHDGDAGDGNNRTFARDAFGMALHYHANDFVNSGSPHTNLSDDVPLRVRPLYNGNIAGWAWNTRTTTSATPPTAIAGRYRYDFLNRLMGDSIFNDAATGEWTAAGLNWSTRYAYDPNGNITALKRYDGAGTDFDMLGYAYASGTNRLDYINDTNAVTGTHPNDIEDQDPGNYTYDLIGNLTADTKENITSISWTPSNKIDSIVKTDSRITYAYDAAGNRVRARVYSATNVLQKTTWYVRDASGTVLSIYEQIESGTMKLKEVPLYGSDRVGIIKPNLAWTSTAKDTIDAVFHRNAKERSYELNDHLGNVRAVVSDEVTLATGGEYLPNVLSRTDYYPFGMAMETRTEQQSGYRYGFNGKENDNDVKVDGGQQDYGFRIYDPRVARFLSVDPLARSFAYATPYSFAQNIPIKCSDLDGAELFIEGTASEELAALISLRTGVDYMVGANGQLVEAMSMVLGAPVQGQRTTPPGTSATLIRVIESAVTSTIPVRITATDDLALNTQIFFDAFESRTVDMHDFKAIDNSPTMQSALLGHIIEEYSNAVRSPLLGEALFSQAHAAGLDVERQIVADFFPGATERRTNNVVLNLDLIVPPIRGASGSPTFNYGTVAFTFFTTSHMSTNAQFIGPVQVTSQNIQVGENDVEGVLRTNP